jgi:methylmalonyl-CoA/ethylmalonyl-CoA epimerase
MTEATQDPRQIFNDLVQIGIVVADVDKSARYLSEIFGIGPFRKIDFPPADRPEVQRYYYGEPGDFTARLAFANAGPVELELIQPVSGKSIWRDFLEQHGEGIHHIRFNVADAGEASAYLAGKGIEPAQWGSGLRPGTTWKYFSTEHLIGFCIEIINRIPGTDGRTPVTEDGKVRA